MLVALSRVLSRDQGSDPSESAALKFKFATVGIPYLLSLLGWFTFFYLYWGSPMPSAPYTGGQTTLSNVFVGAPGLLLDQEYGLLAFAPAYIFAAFGLWTMVKPGGEMGRLAVEIAIVFAAPLGT